MNVNNSTVRTIQILHLISNQTRPLTITEISQTLGIPKSTTYQILQTLVNIKVLEIDGNKTFRLGIRFYEIALPSFNRMDLKREAGSIMEELRDRSGETVFLAAHDADGIIYLDQVEGPTMLRLSVTLGTRGPFHCTALGKAILAALSDDRILEITGGGALPPETKFTLTNHDRLMDDLRATRLRGFAVDNQELQEDISCVGAPVYNAKNEPVGALSIAGHSSRINGRALDQLGKLVRDAALRLSLRLGYGNRSLYPEFGIDV